MSTKAAQVSTSEVDNTNDIELHLIPDNQEKRSIDDVITEIGAFGPFQWVLLAMMCFSVFGYSPPMLIMYFAAASPTWKCVTNSSVCNFTQIMPSENTLRCNISRNEWTYTKPKEFSIVTEFDLVCNQQWLVPFSSSIYFVGVAIGNPLFGSLADRYGRKKILFICSMLLFVSGLLTSFIQHIYIIMCARLITGLFGSGTLVQAFVLLSEYVNNKYRPVASLIFWNQVSLSFCFLTLLAYLVQNWRTIFILTNAPYLVIVFFYKFYPESARWMVFHNKSEQAKRILRKIAKFNKTTLKSEFHTPEKHETKTNLFDLFRLKAICKVSIIQGFAWFVSGMVYFGLCLAASDIGNSLYRDFFLMLIADLPGDFLMLFLSKVYGRKKGAIFTTTVITCLCFSISYIPSTTTTMKWIRIIFGMLGKVCSAAIIDILYVWSNESYPTVIRSKGIGYMAFCRVFGNGCAPWVVISLRQVDKSAPYLLMGIACALSLVTIITLKETKEAAPLEKIEDVK